MLKGLASNCQLEIKKHNFSILIPLPLPTFPGNSTEAIRLNASVYVLACMWYNTEKKDWSGDGCWMNPSKTTEDEACMETTHLTLFSSDWVVGPNTIDFSSVFDNFDEKLLENIHVFATIAGLIIIYFILVFILRRYDKKDVEKVGLTYLIPFE